MGASSQFSGYVVVSQFDMFCQFDSFSNLFRLTFLTDPEKYKVHD